MVYRTMLLALLLSMGTQLSNAQNEKKDMKSKHFKSISKKTSLQSSEKPELIRSDYQSGDLTSLCDAAMQQASFEFDRIAKIPVEERNAENTLLAFEKVNADFSDQTLPLTFMGYVSTQSAISKEASDCEQKVNQFAVSVFTRPDLYRALKDLKNLSQPEARLLSETLKAFENNGLKLPAEQLEQFKKLKQELVLKESQFGTNLNRDESFVEYHLEDLAGLPQEYVKSLRKTEDGSKYIITTKAPDFIRVMENASQPETRRRMLEAYENRVAKENTRLLEEGIQLREKLAAILGFKTWADYRTHDRMAKSAKTVSDFLGGLREKLVKRNQEDLARMLNAKRETDPSATDLKAWDIRYYENQLKKKLLQLDDEKVREYFPLDLVVGGMFKVYSQLLGVHFVEDTGARVWAPGVKLYQIRDGKPDGRNAELIGYFYMDLAPRNGKFGHAAAFPLIAGRTLKDGTYNHPISAIVANFSPSEGSKPVLLKHEEVRTLFHEFGHIMHQTLTRAPYASLSGSSVDQDFVEAPSQMLENWVFSPEVLKSLSGYYLNHQKKLPPELLQKLIEARDFDQGYFYTRQLMLGTLDLDYHTAKGHVDVTQVYRKLYREFMGIEPIANSHFSASFGHLMGGYDAGYYGYLWSEVFAADLFTRFEKEGLLNPKVGMDYRKTILEKGKMEEAMDLLVAFLGRQPNNNAFYKKLHIAGSAEDGGKPTSEISHSGASHSGPGAATVPGSAR